MYRKILKVIEETQWLITFRPQFTAGAWWVVDIPSLDQTTQARTISSVEAAVCEVASLVTRKPIDTFHVAMDIHVEEVPAFQKRAAEIKRTRERAQELERQAQDATRELAAQLAENTAASPETGRRRRR